MGELNLLPVLIYRYDDIPPEMGKSLYYSNQP